MGQPEPYPECALDRFDRAQVPGQNPAHLPALHQVRQLLRITHERQYRPTRPQPREAVTDISDHRHSTGHPSRRPISSVQLPGRSCVCMYVCRQCRSTGDSVSGLGAGRVSVMIVHRPNGRRSASRPGTYDMSHSYGWNVLASKNVYILNE